MLIEHRFQRSADGLCEYCGFAVRLHRYDRPGHVKRAKDSGNTIRPRDRIIGIDGEGKGRRPHRYTYLAATDESGKSWCVSSSQGLSTQQCLELLLTLPTRCLCFGYAFLYDLTKICQDLPDRDLFDLFHEKQRERIVDGRVIYKRVPWNGFKLDYSHRKFTVERGNRKTVIWDIFAFFQSKFTGALKSWQVADEAKLTRMERMKALRSEFDKQSDKEIEAYCNEECSYLARLGRKLIEAHDKAGLRLRAYHGAGSTASAFLAKINVKEHRGECPVGMRVPVACAFFGGRFENSRIGPVRQRVYNYDISSAYPYQAWRLPCLSCGRWRHSSGHPEKPGRLTLVHWRAPFVRGSAWGALPVRLPKNWNRLSKGSIVFPLSGAGGWVWWDEFQAARKLNPAIEGTEYWAYDTDCDHRPFADIPSVYRERVALGKDAQGIVLKLGLNSIYGKLAQSVGINPPFQSWIWAGNITGGCRAQCLGGITTALDPWNVLMIATDGLWSVERLKLPRPLDTGTFDLPKPLGGWEEKSYDRGVFCVRPGIYFPLEPTAEQMDAVRARGLGRKVVYEQWQRIVDGWEARVPEIRLGGVQRFIGAKTGFGVNGRGEVRRRASYGEWILQAIKCSFSARPKRERRTGHYLAPWRHVEVESIPYEKAFTEDGIQMAIEEMIAEEQPNADYGDIA